MLAKPPQTQDAFTFTTVHAQNISQAHRTPPPPLPSLSSSRCCNIFSSYPPPWQLLRVKSEILKGALSVDGASIEGEDEEEQEDWQSAVGSEEVSSDDSGALAFPPLDNRSP